MQEIFDRYPIPLRFSRHNEPPRIIARSVNKVILRMDVLESSLLKFRLNRREIHFVNVGNALPRTSIYDY